MSYVIAAPAQPSVEVKGTADRFRCAAFTARYPTRTSNFHHEVELVVALSGGGVDIAVDKANSLIFGYAVRNDLTRRSYADSSLR